MKKILKILFFLIIFAASANSKVKASETISNSAELKGPVKAELRFDKREIRLRKFLQKHNSPLTDYSFFFIEKADEYNLDWRLLPAIAGVESSFGKRIPAGSYNPFGWANGEFRFASWEESIETVSKSLREKYYNKGLKNINSIAKVYAPPSKTWASKVIFFMNKIETSPKNLDFEF